MVFCFVFSLAEAFGCLSATGLGCFVDSLSVSHFFEAAPPAGGIQSFYHFVVGSYQTCAAYFVPACACVFECGLFLPLLPIRGFGRQSLRLLFRN